MKKQTEICHYESSMISSSFYNFESGKLLVEFNGGALYEFLNVSLDDYRSFSESDSVGKAFNSHIRQYNGIKVEDSQIEDIRNVFPANVEGSEEFNEANQNMN
jgi:hypothetical protein